MRYARAAVKIFAAVAWMASPVSGVGGESPIDFDREVAPVLSARCFSCHGAVGPEAGLDLTRREGATAELESGERAVVSDHPETSELVRRITADEFEGRMPPEGEPLSSDEVETLRRWIAEGATWPLHWAYRPVRKPRPPRPVTAEESAWVRNPIDRFILVRLREKGLDPSDAAEKRTWLRRVTFDLTGLPPTPEELIDFTSDESPDACERVADRLLASPHYGERWARHWMDVAHFAETHGHDQDRPRPNAWPYRDYLIRSFNVDKPYGRFIEEQIAGDVIAPDDPQAIAATGFLAAGPWDESSLRDIREDSLDREIARYLDRDDIVSSVMTTLTSTTVHCTRCHDHKFDPITHEQYYGLQAVFAGIDKAERPFDPDPAVARRRNELLARRVALPARRQAIDPSLLDPALQAEIAVWESEIASAESTWIVLDPIGFDSTNGATLTELPDHSLLSGGNRPETDVVKVTASVSIPTVTGFRIEVLPDAALPQQGPGRQDNGNLHLNELTVAVADSADARPLVLRNASADFDQAGWTAAMAIDGNPTTAWGIFPEIGKPHQAVFELAEPVRSEDTVTFAVRLAQTHGGGHLIGRVRISATAASPPLSPDVNSLPAEIAAILGTPRDRRSDVHRATLATYYLERKIDRELAALPPQQKVYAGTNRFQPDGSFRPAERPRTIHVLLRGDVRQPGAVAEPGALSCISGFDGPFSVSDPNDEGSRRVALARWLSDPRNVLVWRSIVNRVWQYHFSRGLVDTPNDFGRMGATPSHPELLDWLTAELIDANGSLKHLHRLIITSATYRQASAHHAGSADVDGDNRLLWRMNRMRLDAESIRDAALCFSGELDSKMGGPSVKQFIETPGVHVTPNVDYRGFDFDGPAVRRRSVYRFLFRTLPDPFLESLDCPDGSQSTARRAESVTAFQALAMLNDPFVIRRSERLAARLQQEESEPPGQIRRLFELVLLREPTEGELADFVEYAADYGLANAVRMLLNSNEFLFVD
ncbi:MAG: PSD1 and planctomycete cytochrome C domain-containing protein [Planctomycetaceae bacterium]